jgi:hypothetical protein
MPSAPPSSLLVSAIPEATPARAGGALPTINSVPRDHAGRDAEDHDHRRADHQRQGGPLLSPSFVISRKPAAETNIPPAIA